MTPQALEAFSQASGSSVESLRHLLVLAFFVIAIFWAVIVLIGKLKSMAKAGEVDVMNFSLVVIQLMAVLVMVLIFVSG
jgi:hypothetical protein